MENEEFNKKIQELVNEYNKPVFSDEEYAMFKKCNLTAEEIDNLEKTELLSRVAALLPQSDEDVKKVIAALGAISTDSTEQNFKNLQIIIEKDPKRFSQIMAASAIIDNEAESLVAEAKKKI